MSPTLGYTPAVSAHDLAVAHPGATRPALVGVNFTAPPGCRLALVGPNGAGKSTLLRTLAGLLPPAAGSASILGAPARAGRPEIDFLAQRAAIEWHFPISVLNLVLGGRRPTLGWFRSPGRQDEERARAALERVRLADLANKSIHALSGGQQQRILLARALCREARVLLLDEPYAGLDTTSRDIMETIFFGPGSETLTLLMATHEPGHAEGRFDLVLSANDGRVETTRPCTCRHAPLAH